MNRSECLKEIRKKGWISHLSGLHSCPACVEKGVHTKIAGKRKPKIEEVVSDQRDAQSLNRKEDDVQSAASQMSKTIVDSATTQ